MKSKWIKTGDRVVITCGNDLGTIGTVLAKKGDRILVQGVNVRRRHMKSRKQEQRSEIINIERPIHVSNVALCNMEGKILKLRSEVKEDGSKELVYVDNGKKTNYRTLRKGNV